MADQSLEALVSRYRRSGSDPSLAGADVELEVRFRGVDFAVFETVLAALVAGTELPVEAGAVAHTVNAIMADEPGMRRTRHRGAQDRGVQLIRQITFEGGVRAREEYRRKWALAPPFRVQNAHGLDYAVELSAEEPMVEEFTSDAGAVIRVKCRASFAVRPGWAGAAAAERAGAAAGEGRWRVDLTVVRQIAGSDARASLPAIVKAMFPPKMTAADMLERLGLAEPDSERRGLYQYEIEVEHVPDGRAGREAARPSEVAAIVARVLHLANPDYLREALFQAEVFHVAGLVVGAPGYLRRFEHELGLKRLLPQVTALTRAGYKDIYPPTGYFLLDKADGVRAVASVRGGRLLVLADRLLEFYAPGFSADGPPPAERPLRFVATTVVDGELVDGGEGRPPVFHAFDVVALLSENLAAAGYEERVGHLADATALLVEFGLDARPKPVVHLTASDPEGLRAQFRAPELEKRPYDTDGLILVQPKKPYLETAAFKWKPLADTTIDFLARRAPPGVLGRPPFVERPGHELYLLFVGIDPVLFEALGLELAPGYQELFGGAKGRAGGYFPVQFAPSDAPLAYLYHHPAAAPKGAAAWRRDLDGLIVELRCGGAECAGAQGAPDWRLVRVRDDRARDVRGGQYFGNDFRVAELTWLNYVDPFDDAQLWEGPELGYFAAPKSAMMRAQTDFTSFVKSRRIAAEAAHAAWVVDLAVGKGQDLGRYVKAGVRHLVGVDRDQSALSELVRRKYTHALKRRGAVGRQKGPTTLYALRADLAEPFETTAERIRGLVGFPAGGADVVVTNLAVHYFAGTAEGLRNYIELCRALVKVGGAVVITAMLGHRVHALLAKARVRPGESWDARQNEVLKYSIRRDYAEDRLTETGQRVGVLLPFSNGEYYEEFLVNVEFLTDEFVARGFRVASVSAFDASFGNFRTSNPSSDQLLTEADREYLRLYGEIVLRRER